MKPFSFQRFIKAVSKVPVKTQPDNKHKAEAPHSEPKKEIFIKSGYEYIKINTDHITFIKSDADYTEVHTSEKMYLSSESLRFWLDNLSQHQFVRIHKSYIINVAGIVKVAGNQVYLGNDIVVPIGRAYKDDFTEKFLK